MTSLVFALQPDQVCVAMDTLVVGAEDRKPMCFQRKFLALPKIDLIVAGTGLANLINGWFSFVSSLQHLSDIDELNELAPATLKASVDAAGVCDSITTTLYHFGYSKGENKYIGYAYRSTSGFQSEKLPYALGLKPVVSVTPTDDIRFPEFLVNIVLEQQRQDRLLPISEQLGIGGEIEFAVLADRTTRIETVHRFTTHESEKQHIERYREA